MLGVRGKGKVENKRLIIKRLIILSMIFFTLMLFKRLFESIGIK